MGQYFSANRQGRVQELNISSNEVYRYPPKSGSYFGGHFVMGGKEFESISPEAYLFGENSDLNYLSPKPQQFPYKPSTAQEPIRALRCLVNIRKDSLRLVKVASPMMKAQDTESEPVQEIINTEATNGWFYNIEFTFDTDCPCLVTVYYNATEESVNKSVIYTTEPVNECSATVQYQAGCNQQFCLPSHMIHESKLKVSDGSWNSEFKHIPVVIQILAQNGPEHAGHSHITYAEFYKPTDNNWSIRAVKQKQAIDGVCYLLQEIYGIEHKKQNQEQGTEHEEEEIDSSNSECVVCLSDTRDTLILPCKHLCLCSSCANQLRYQQSGCPICRQSFRALLQIRAVRRKDPNADSSNVSQQSVEEVAVDIDAASQDLPEIPIPEGYEIVSLIDTVNGTLNTTNSSSTLAAPASPSHIYAEIRSTSSDNVTTEDETKKKKVQTKKEEEVSEEEDVVEDVEVVAKDTSSSPSDVQSVDEEEDDSSNEAEVKEDPQVEEAPQVEDIPKVEDSFQAKGKHPSKSDGESVKDEKPTSVTEPELEDQHLNTDEEEPNDENDQQETTETSEGQETNKNHEIVV